MPTCAALLAEGVELLTGGFGLAGEALCFLLEAGEGCGGLRLLVAGLAGALDELHGGAAMLLQPAARRRRRSGRRPGLRPAAARRLARDCRRLRSVAFSRKLRCCSSSPERLASCACACDSSSAPDARRVRELGDAVGVGGGAGGDALEFDGGSDWPARRLRESARRERSRCERLRSAGRPWSRCRRTACRSGR